jgi:hypothetical protein
VAWRTAFDMGTATNNVGGWSGYTLRVVVSSSLLGGSFTKLRVTYLGGVSATARVGETYVQESAGSGDIYDFATTPSQILFSGVFGFTALAANTRLLSDELSLSLPGTSDLVITTYTDGTGSFSAAFSNDLTGTTVRPRYRLANEAATVNATTGYSTTGSSPIVMLELFSPDAVAAPTPPPRAYRFVGLRQRPPFFPTATPRPVTSALTPAPIPPAALPQPPVALRAYPGHNPIPRRERFFPFAYARYARYVPSLTQEEITPRTSTFNIFTLMLEVFDENGDAYTMRTSTKAMITGSNDRPADTTFRELLIDPGDVRTQIFGNGRSAGLVAPTWGSIEFDNTSGAFDGWTEYATDGGKVTCYYGPYGGAYPAEFRKVYVAYIEGSPYLDNRIARFELRGREKLLERKIVTRGFTGESGVWYSDMADLVRTGVAGARMRQIVMGTPGYFEPILTNDLDSIWFVQDNTYSLGGAGSSEAYDGGVKVNPGGYMSSPTGPLWFRFGTEPRVEVRVKTTGYYSTPTVTARRWTVCDIATTVGITGIDATNLPAGSVNFDAGNRLVETQTAKEVLDDIANFEVASIGFNRLDQFYARRIEPWFVIGSGSVYTFRDGGSRSDGNSRGWTWSKIPGMEKRVWQVSVHAGATRRSSLAGIPESDEIRDALSRDPWTSNFTVNVTYNSGPPFYQASTILDTDPTAEKADVEIIGNEFPDTAAMEAWGERFMRLHGAKSVACSLETEFSLDTMAIEPCDQVTLQTQRFGGSRFAIVWQKHMQLKQRTIRFGCWSHRQYDAPSSSEISIDLVDDTVGAGGGSGPSGGARGAGDAAPQDETFYIACSDETTALTTGVAKRTWYCTYAGGFYITGLVATLTTPQTSGSVFTVDFNVNAASWLSTKLTIDNTENTSGTAATPCVLTSNLMLFGDKVTIDIDQLGTGAKGLSVAVIGYQVTAA